MRVATTSALSDHKKCIMERGPTSSDETDPFPKAKGTDLEGTTAMTGKEVLISSEGVSLIWLLCKMAIGRTCFASFMSSGVIG